MNLVSVIFKSIKIRKSSEISTKFNTKTLCLYRYGFFWCQKSLKTLQLINRIKAWIAILLTIITTIYSISCLELVLYLGVSKFDFSDNFVSKNSVQIQNFTSWHHRGVNLVDSSVSCTKQTSKRALV